MHNLQYLHDRKQKNIFLLLSLIILTLFLAVIGLAFYHISEKNITVRSNPLFAIPMTLAIISWISVLVMTCITSMKCVIAKPITTVSYAIMLVTVNTILLTNQGLFSKLYYSYSILIALLNAFALFHLYLLNVLDIHHRYRLSKDTVAFLLAFITVFALTISSILSFRMTYNFYIVFYVFYVLIIFQLIFALHDIYYLNKRFFTSPILNLIQVGLGIYLLIEARISINTNYKVMFGILALLVLLSFIGFAYNTFELIKRHIVKARLENSK